MSAVARLDEYRHRRDTRDADRLAFEEQRQHGLHLRREAKLRRLADARAAQAQPAHTNPPPDTHPGGGGLVAKPVAADAARAPARPDRMASTASTEAVAAGSQARLPADDREGSGPARPDDARPSRQRLALVAEHEADIAAPDDDIAAPDDQETFDLGPPADAILDTPYDAELFDDCAYDTVEEEYPCDQEAC